MLAVNIFTVLQLPDVVIQTLARIFHVLDQANLLADQLHPPNASAVGNSDIPESVNRQLGVIRHMSYAPLILCLVHVLGKVSAAHC